MLNFTKHIKRHWSEASHLHPADLFIPFSSIPRLKDVSLAFLTVVVFGALNKLASGTASLHLYQFPAVVGCAGTSYERGLQSKADYRFLRKDNIMSKETDKSTEPSEPDVSWIHWFQRTKHENPKGLLIFLSVLNDFVIKHPDDAKYLTVETMHAILMDEI